jgi:DNA-binding response OmpR family regulator
MNKSFTILIVDDETDIRKSVRQVLEDEGFKVISAKDGQECIEKAIKKEPDLILLDILMPGLTTKEVLAGLKKNKVKSKVMFLTVVRLAEALKLKVLKGNMVDYLEKPFDNKELVRRVKKALNINGKK